MSTGLQNTLLAALLREQQNQQATLLDERNRMEEQKRYNQQREDVVFERLSRERELEEAAKEKEFARRLKVAELMGKQDEIRMRLEGVKPPERKFQSAALQEIYQGSGGMAGAEMALGGQAYQRKRSLEDLKADLAARNKAVEQYRGQRLEVGDPALLPEARQGMGPIEAREYYKSMYRPEGVDKEGRPLPDYLKWRSLTNLKNSIDSRSRIKVSGPMATKAQQAYKALRSMYDKLYDDINFGRVGEAEGLAKLRGSPQWQLWDTQLNEAIYAGLSEPAPIYGQQGQGTLRTPGEDNYENEIDTLE